MKLSVFVMGVSGRMGQEVVKEINARPHEVLLQGGTSRSQPQVPKQKPGLIIDFSLPENLANVEELVLKFGSPLVSGTTGYSAEQMTRLRELGKSAPVFWSANMSFGVYIFCQLAEALAQYHQLYRLQIEETHHVHKKDKPSGTALMIETAAKRSAPSLLPTLSHREGEVFGIHLLNARSDKELLQIRHEALDRGLFAQGALDVGLWLTQKPVGFYEMKDFFADFSSGSGRK